MSLTFRKFLLTLFLITSLFFSEISTSQQPFIRKISFLEGLSSEVVFDLFVDKEGLLYLGTDRGLLTYNGVHFEEIDFESSLGNSVTNIQQDSNGTIWCKNFANQLFYLRNEKLVADKTIKALLKKTDTNLVDFAVSSSGMYVLTSTRLYSYVNGELSVIIELNKKGVENFNSMVFDTKNQKLYVSSTFSMYTFHNKLLLQKKNVTTEQKVLEIYKGELAYIAKSLTNSCVVGKNRILLKDYDLESTFLNRFTATNQELWLCTNKGIYEFNKKNDSFKDGFLKDSRITDIVQDLEGNYWISSLDEGLFMMPNRNIFELNISAFQKKGFTRIAKGPNGNYFTGTNDGQIIEIATTGKSVRVYETHWDNNIEFISFMGDTITTNYGFFKIGNSKIISNDVYFGKDLVDDRKGNLLMAASSFGGLIPKDLKGKPNYNNLDNKYLQIAYGVNRIETLVFRNKRTKSILYHPTREEYYYGFIDGLFVYDCNGNEKEIRTKENECIVVSEMLLNADGSIWIASVQNGIFLLKNNKIIDHISEKNGLSDNNCKRIAKDDHGIWIVTESGFDYYDSLTKHIKNAQLNLCIKGITINDVAIYKELVVMASNKGIYYFNKKILNQVVIPNFKVTAFLVNNKKVNSSEDLVLKYNQNNINIKFNTIHYKSLGNYNYRYRLKGLDDKWFTSSSNAKNINFLALTPGEYKFQIHIKIGEKYTPIQEINFEIQKPFWLQFWFLTILILGVMASLYFVYRWTELKTRKSEELKEQLALSQLTALRSQMNPHFIFNVLNAVQGLIYSNQKSKASDYLGKFSDLMRKILDTSDKNEVTIEKEFETIDLYVSLEKARFDDDFEYTIAFPVGEDLSNYTIPSMIIQPFVENAIKHGLMHKSGFKRLNIEAELLEGVWCFTIDDNGIGRKASEIINQKIKKHISFATKAIDNRIKLINKMTDIAIDIEIIDKKSTADQSLGTRIKIYIPIKNK